MSGLSDSYQRPIDYLRVSVTDRCNLRCMYCVPAQGIACMRHEDILTYEEILAIVRAAARLGIRRVRLSGGEPMVRIGFLDLARMIASVDGIDDLSLTTNGILLAENAFRLREAGIKRVNVSLDTLRKDRFLTITRREGFEDVLLGIQKAREAGLEPVKVNMVVMRGINDDEVVDFGRKTVEAGWHVRFIELMPFNSAASAENRFVGIPEVKQKLSALGILSPVASLTGNGPARYFRFAGATGTVGFISPVSEHFCFGCNRLRLTADGKLRPCLLADEEIDLREALRGGRPDLVEKLIREAVERKPRQHLLKDGKTPRRRAMTHIGG